MATKDMNSLMRYGGRGAKTGVIDGEEEVELAPARGSREFTVQAPGVHSPTDQFIYEPFLDMDGAWVVYPPGVECDPNEYRIARATPADTGDFSKMQAALAEESSEGAPPPTGDASGPMGGAGLPPDFDEPTEGSM